MRTRPNLGIWDWMRAPHRGYRVEWMHYPSTEPGSWQGWKGCVAMAYQPTTGTRRRDGVMFSPENIGRDEPMGWRPEMARILVRLRKRLRYREPM